jgi:hypothetical protein
MLIELQAEVYPVQPSFNCDNQSPKTPVRAWVTAPEPLGHAGRTVGPVCPRFHLLSAGRPRRSSFCQTEQDDERAT